MGYSRIASPYMRRTGAARYLALWLILAAVFLGCLHDRDSMVRADRIAIETTKVWIVRELQTQAKVPGAPVAWADPQGVKIEYYTKDPGDTEPGLKAIVLSAKTEDAMWIVRVYGDGRPVLMIEEIRMVPPDQAVHRALPSFRTIDPSRWNGKIPTEAEFMNSKWLYTMRGRLLKVRMPNRGAWSFLTKPDGSIDLDPGIFIYNLEEDLSGEQKVESVAP